MGKNSRISWTHHTFNTHWGCEKVSPACDGCYAEAQAKRYGHQVWGKDAPRRMLSDKNWGLPLKWDRAAAKVGERHRVFCSSMADVFEDRRDLDGVRLRLWELIKQTPNLDWLLLTKRPENFTRMLPTDWLRWPQPNVWLGTTGENQRRADERLKWLLAVPAVVHFLSAEPLLGPIVLRKENVRNPEMIGQLGWVIAGGESGPQARPMHPQWAQRLRFDCAHIGMAFHFKQWGEWAPHHEGHPLVSVSKYRTSPSMVTFRPDGSKYNPTEPDSLQHPEMQSMFRIGKQDAGRVLDGRVWDEFPEAHVKAKP